MDRDEKPISPAAQRAIADSKAAAEGLSDGPLKQGYINEAIETRSLAEAYTAERQRRGGDPYPKIFQSQTKVPAVRGRRGYRQPDLVVQTRSESDRSVRPDSFLVDIKTRALAPNPAKYSSFETFDHDYGDNLGQLESFAQAKSTTLKSGTNIPVMPELSSVAFSSSSSSIMGPDVDLLKRSGIKRARSNSMTPGTFLPIPDFLNRRAKVHPETTKRDQKTREDYDHAVKSLPRKRK